MSAGLLWMLHLHASAGGVCSRLASYSLNAPVLLFLQHAALARLLTITALSTQHALWDLLFKLAFSVFTPVHTQFTPRPPPPPGVLEPQRHLAGVLQP